MSQFTCRQNSMVNIHVRSFQGRAYQLSNKLLFFDNFNQWSVTNEPRHEKTNILVSDLV